MYLDSINSPQDLKKLRLEELPELASEIRKRIIDVVSVSGGHLASSLGAVELTIALHYCFDTPRDKIIWDVGHQSYTHKIITGRNKDFSKLRQYQGISGFPCKDESIYDTFTTGHSSTAVSLALGLACGRDLLPKDQYFKIVAVIGDGSLSGGLCFEGLNNTGHLKKDILIVLNTNELSIAPNVGALSTYLNKLISLPIYNRFMTSLEGLVKSRIPKGSRIIKIAKKFEGSLKGLFVPGIFFEELGFRYFGPLDGHNINLLISTLRNIINIKGPVLLHVITRKGKGYPPAEKEPVRFHSAAPFDIATGKDVLQGDDGLKQTYTQIFSQKLVDLAKDNQKIVAITAAMADGTGLDKFRDKYPERFFDVGIAEEHAVCFAAGLAREGFKPITAIYSTFLQRAYDQIIECVALQEMDIIFAIDRAGIVGADGATHQGIFDIAYLRSIPNLVIMAPKDGNELANMLEFAISLNKPVAIRYPKDNSPVEPMLPYQPLEIGKAEVLKNAKDALIIALGSMVLPSLKAAESLAKEGIDVGVINSRFVKPLDLKLLKNVTRSIKFIFTVEEGILEGGFGSAIMEEVNQPVIRIGLPSEFIPCGSRGLLLDKYGLTTQGIARKIKSIMA